MIFITVCIFARARAYSRQYPTRHWGTVAKIFAGLSLLGGLANLAKSLPGNESTQDLDMLVTAANKSVPRQIAENVRLDRVSREARTFIYAYTITGPSRVPSPSERASVRDETVKAVCGDSDARRLLLSLDRTTFRYSNEAGEPLITFGISSRDCH
jgi:hypothetical protein